jgi:hypothetical protein
MSIVTSLIISVHAFHPQTEEKILRDIQWWIQQKGHSPFWDVGAGGGEKNLTCTLLIGSFSSFETERFCEWIKKQDWFDPSGEANQIEVMAKEVDREDFAKWKVIFSPG